MGIAKGDIVRLYISKEEILSCIERARHFNFHDNLRNRHPNVKFDSKLRGYIGELAFKNWLKLNGVEVATENEFQEDTMMDVDIGLTVKGKNLAAELKTSLIPDKDGTLENVLANRDIKLIKRGAQPIDELHCDLHIQIYFNQLARAKDNWLKTRKLNFDTEDLEELYYQAAAYRYIYDTHLTGWIDKTALVELHGNNEQTWHFKNSKRVFWKCSLNKDAKKPAELIAYLKS